ncbi:MAG TPA: glycosyltransferase [Gemmatimonadales bacterium]|nr:glycosyltransferase [Gemmatimonadales bacterium]
MNAVALAVLMASASLGLYAYVGYPLLLLALRRRPHRNASPSRWPDLSITVPIHNEAANLRGLLENLLALEYPGRRQILVVSDGSTDTSDAIVANYAKRGIELLRLTERRGKTAAENAARPYLKGEIIINTDASVRLHPRAVKQLVAAFTDPSVGVASACDVSVANPETQVNAGEGAYVGYEMWVRDRETAVDGIVGASGCLYAIRADLHMHPVPEALSRDFSAALTAREHGRRAVSVPDALCFVPRSASLHQEYRRKVRTITRGLATLAHRRALLNPLRYGAFAWMLFSHKVCRWLVPWALVLALGALGALAVTSLWARIALAGAMALGALAGVAWMRPAGEPMPRLLALPAYVAAGNLAVLQAWLRFWAGRSAPVWEPTRRGLVS